MKTIKMIIALFAILFTINTQDVDAQRPSLGSINRICNNCGSSQQEVKKAVLNKIPRRLHSKINFNELFRTGKTTVSPRPTGPTTFANPNTGGTEKKECSNSSSTGVDSNGNKNKCTTVVCHYTSIDVWTVNTYCIKIK